jgi:hypothetical protein
MNKILYLYIMPINFSMPMGLSVYRSSTRTARKTRKNNRKRRKTIRRLRKRKTIKGRKKRKTTKKGRNQRGGFMRGSTRNFCLTK